MKILFISCFAKYSELVNANEIENTIYVEYFKKAVHLLR